MTTCELNGSYPIAKIQGNIFYYLRNIKLSEDCKSIIINKYVLPSEDPDSATNAECELNIEGNGVGLYLDNLTLKFVPNPKPVSDCSIVTQLIKAGNPKIEILNENNLGIINFIGIEDIRITRSSRTFSIPLQNGLNIINKTIDGRESIVFQIWERA